MGRGRAATALIAAGALALPVAGAYATRDSVGRPGSPTHLTVDGLVAPVGLGQDDVNFGWYLGDDRRGAVQSAYRILVSRPLLAGRDRGRSVGVWDSGRVKSPRQAFVHYAGPRLAPDTTYEWTVQTWDGEGVASSVSHAQSFDTALGNHDWHADWIKRLTAEPDDNATSLNLQSGLGIWANKDEYTYVRKDVRLDASPIVRARAYVSADQQYELYVNGSIAGKGQAFQFPDRQYYETLDVTRLLRAGADNAFGIVYSWQGPGKGRAPGEPGVIAHISVLHADGRSDLITTDGTWRVLPGAWLPGTQRDEEGDPVDYTEYIDGPAEPVGWDRPGYEDAAWAPATVIGAHPVTPWTHLVPLRARIVYTPIHPVSITRLPSGAVVADFGKVYAAIPKVSFKLGVPGHLVTMRAGFLLDSSGAVSTTRGTQHTDMSYGYVQRGGHETFRPFDYLAFRYLQVDDPVTAVTIQALARHVAVPSLYAGRFRSSNATLDAVYRLAARSALYTMQEQFVDTPAREKGSWLGDGRNESEAAMAAFDDVNMTRKSLLEFAQSQARFWSSGPSRGTINKLYPTGIGPGNIPEGSEMYPDWVWQYWQRTADRATVKTLLPVVERVADLVWRNVDHSDDLVTNFTGTSGFAFPTDMLLNELAVDDFNRVAQLETALGHSGAENRHRADIVRHGINAHLVAPNGVYYVGLGAGHHPVLQGPHKLNAESRQGDNAFALLFDVPPQGRRARVERYITRQGMATPPIFAGDMLQSIGLEGDDRTALHLLTDDHEPGWANILARGGTFGWEVWNPDDRDVAVGGTFLGSLFGNGDTMSHGFSANVLDAIQQSLLGVRATKPGFDVFDVSPPRHVLRFAQGTVPTPHGTIAVSWLRGRTFTLHVTVPPNTTATVHLPGESSPVTLGAGSYTLR
jgi:alpha-L-rhamnosidase